MYRVSFLMALVLCLAAVAGAQPNELILPAGTILKCTLAEPNFSSKTVQLDDPILCHVGPFAMFGYPAFPRGAYLAGRLADSREPGRFFGKGWLKLEFDRLVLPSESVPLPAKVASVPHFKVDEEGRIHGRGHAGRDALGWAIPMLWPVKVITLPMRGPRPTLRGEARINLRLLEDVHISPTGVALNSGVALPSPQPAQSGSRANVASTRAQESAPTRIFFPRIWYGGSSRPAAAAQVPMAALRSQSKQAGVTKSSPPLERQQPVRQLTLLILKDGSGYLANDYWIDAEQLHYVSHDGTPQSLPLERLDLGMTVQLNRERGVNFVLRSEH